MHALLPLLVLVVSSTPKAAVPAEKPLTPLEILFVGNSYTYRNDLPRMVAALAQAAGTRPLHYEMVAPGGATLAAHWGNGAGDAVQALAARHRDVVVLQEQSQLPLLSPELFHQSARLLDERIRKAGARTLLYVTWARQSAPMDQQALTAAYAAVARERQATLVPVGPVWQAVHQAMPALVLYDADGSHPSPTGTYLAALTFYAVLFDRSPVGLPARLMDGGQVSVEVEPAVAAALQRLVWEAVHAPAR